LLAGPPRMPMSPLPEHHLIVNTYILHPTDLHSTSQPSHPLPLSFAFSARCSVLRPILHLEGATQSNLLTLQPSLRPLSPCHWPRSPFRASRLLHLELTRMFREIHPTPSLRSSRRRDGRLRHVARIHRPTDCVSRCDKASHELDSGRFVF